MEAKDLPQSINEEEDNCPVNQRKTGQKPLQQNHTRMTPKTYNLQTNMHPQPTTASSQHMEHHDAKKIHKTHNPQRVQTCSLARQTYKGKKSQYVPNFLSLSSCYDQFSPSNTHVRPLAS
jgi:hypothetical protein